MEPTNKKEAPRHKSRPYPIVAIGASAGGMEAITELLTHLPPHTGMAYMYLQHMDRDYKSNLTAILSRSTKMKVLQAKNLMKIEPDCLFVLPPGKDMQVVDGVVKVTARPKNNYVHLPIDYFFTSLAEKQRDGSIGIVLSGAASDGTAGLKAIKSAGGITFAQDESARFSSMPKSAISEGVVDFVLSPKEMAEELERLSKNKNAFSFAGIEADDEQPDEDIASIIQIIKKSLGVDFEHYKMSTIRRRIIRRMLLYKLESLSEYVQYIKQHANEVPLLYADLLINVTTFFRDSESVKLLKERILPELLQNKTNNEPLRIWVPACATGEELYSLAILVLEILGDKANEKAVQIFGTDLSAIAINKARLGIYTINEVANVSSERLQNYFKKIDGSYRINKNIRDFCVFATHNVLKDPPFSRIDLISCCNLLIYLNTPLQKKLLNIFHYGLKSTGYLLLGKSETIATASNLFVQADKKVKIYSAKKEASHRAMFDLKYQTHLLEKNTSIAPRPEETGKANNTSLNALVDNIFLSHYVPASVIINYNLDILQFRGKSSLFLEPPQGQASLNLLKMVQPELALKLKTTIAKCLKSGRPFKSSGFEIKSKDGVKHVAIEILPLDAAFQEPLLLVIFEEVKVLETFDPQTPTKDQQHKQLEAEIAELREELQTMLQEHEAAHEELQSSNEEIVSSNEELQSINEELETSKEEIESTNEELMTINQELLIRNEQLAESQEYTEAMITTIREAALVLDKEFRIKSANGAFYKTFGLNEKEVTGHYLFEIGDNQWNIPKLREILISVVHNNHMVTDIEINHTFPNRGEKFLLINARQVIQKVYNQQLILVAIEDITEHRLNQRLIAEREAWLRSITDNVPAMIWVAGTEKQYTYLNKSWLAFTGRSLKQEINNGWLENIHKDDVGIYLDIYRNNFDKKTPFQIEYRMRRYDGEYRWVLCNAVPTYNPHNEFSGFTGSCSDIHDKRMVTDELEKRVAERTREWQDANSNLKRSNKELEEFAYVASHDLQEPLRKIQTFSDLLQKNADENLPDATKLYLKKITASAHRMTQLIDDLLNFSRISQSNKTFDKVDLTELAKDLLADFEEMIREKEAKVTCGPLCTIEANAVQMRQLLHNLLSNALKFSSEVEKPVIEISCTKLTDEEKMQNERFSRNNTYYKIIVKDNGIGFQQSYAEQIFTLFQRLHERSKYSGTGIGLALCRKIADNHNGSIYAQSEEGKGTVFTVILPEKQS